MPQVNKSALIEVPVWIAYEVVTEVQLYPEFLPGCRSVDIIERTSNGLVAKVMVARQGMSESFVTDNVHIENESVQMNLRSGPFRKLQGGWCFKALGDVGCRIDLHLDYEPRGMLVALLSTMIDPLTNTVIDAFTQRMVARYAQDETPR